MSVVVQSLLHTPVFREFFVGGEHRLETDFRLFNNQMLRSTSRARTGSPSCILPSARTPNATRWPFCLRWHLDVSCEASEKYAACLVHRSSGLEPQYPPGIDRSATPSGSNTPTPPSICDDETPTCLMGELTKLFQVRALPRHALGILCAAEHATLCAEQTAAVDVDEREAHGWLRTEGRARVLHGHRRSPS